MNPSFSSSCFQVRAAHERFVPSKLLEELEEGMSLTTNDWKMKFTAFQYRESQPDFFGKTGIPWNGMMIAYKEGGEIRVEFVDIIVHDSKEDAVSSFQQLVVGWKAIVRRHPTLNKTFLRTDGAMCYSCVRMCKLLALSERLSGMRVVAHFLGEAGKNKTPLDGHFGARGKMARTEIVKAHGTKDAVDADTLVRVLAGDRMASSYTVSTTTDRTPFPNSGCNEIKGIAHMSERRYEYSSDGHCTGVLFRQQSGLGVGLRLTSEELLGDLASALIPVALEHAVNENVGVSSTPLCTSLEKEEIMTKAGLKRKVRAEKHAEERSVAAKFCTRERIKASSLFACCDHPHGNKNCNRTFFKRASLEDHTKFGRHSNGIHSPWELSTTRPADVEPGLPLVIEPRITGEIRQVFVKAAEPRSTEHQRWSLEFAQHSRIESGAAVSESGPVHVDWEGVVEVPYAGSFVLDPVQGGVAVFKQLERSGRRTLPQFDILIACHKVGGDDPTQKMNHWAVSRIMQEACLPEGVAVVAQEHPQLTLFAAAAERGVALLSSRLEVLDPSQVKPYLSKSHKELLDLRRGLLERRTRRRSDLRKHFLAAERKEGTRLLMLEKASILVLAGELAGKRESTAGDDSSVIDDETPSVVVNRRFETYLASLTPAGPCPIPWALLKEAAYLDPDLTLLPSTAPSIPYKPALSLPSLGPSAKSVLDCLSNSSRVSSSDPESAIAATDNSRGFPKRIRRQTSRFLD
jgi:hypothetical protein